MDTPTQWQYGPLFEWRQDGCNILWRVRTGSNYIMFITTTTNPPTIPRSPAGTHEEIHEGIVGKNKNKCVELQVRVLDLFNIK